MTYFLVVDTPTNRVIAYADRELKPLGANTYLGQVGALPEGLTDKNCWQYRFHGGALKHAPGQRPDDRTSAGAVLREAKYSLRKTAIDRAQQGFRRKMPLTALVYIATLDAARKWLAGQEPEPVERGFIPSREKAEEFMALHYQNLEEALEHYVPLMRKLDAIEAAPDAAALEKIAP